MLCQAYLTHLLRKFIHVVAGFSQTVGNYFLACAAYEPPYALQKQLWPWVKECKPRFKACVQRYN